MKVLLTIWGSRGDLQPMLGLGVGLRKAGHEVLVGGPPNFESWTRSHGLEFIPVGLDIYAFSQQENDLAKSPGHAARRLLKVLRSDIPSQFAQLKDVIPAMDRVVCTGFQLAACSLAEKARVPFNFVAMVPGVLKSPHHTPAVLPYAELPRWLNPLAWRFIEILFQRAVGNDINREREALGLRAGMFADTVFGDDIFIASDPELSEVPPGIDKRYIQTGAWLLRSGDPLPPELEAFLNAGAPPYYFGFGSVPNASPGETTRMFVEAVRAIGGRGIVSQGWANLGREPLPEGFISIGGVAHEKLFPRVAAVIHHGGAGTTQTTARAGVPQVVVPHGADQHYWAHRVEKLGLGPGTILSTKLTLERLKEKLTRIEREPALMERARAMGDRLRAVDGVALAIRHLEERGQLRRTA